MSAGALIVGASQAGVQLAASLRLAGYPDRITLIGAERHPPYQRPPLSTPALFTDEADPAALALRAPEFYRQQGIDLRLNERVERVRLDQPDSAGRGVAYTRTGRVLPFTHLALTTGARPRRLSVPGATLDGVLYLRDLDDARRLRERLTPGARIVVIGGGFIGLETAAVAAGAGATVTVVEAASRVMARAVAPAISDFYHRAHQHRGVTLYLGVGVRAIRAVDDQAGGEVRRANGHARPAGREQPGGDQPRAGGDQPRVGRVELTDGTVLPADIVVVGVGVQPRTELAEQLGLACADGILVNERARTSHPAIVAAGDCTALPHPVTGRGHVRLESVPNAIAQARVAAATLAGTPPPAPEVPWFWSDQFDLKLQMAGLADGHDTTVVRGDETAERLTVLYYRGDELIAVHAVNRPADYLAGRLALTRRIPIPAALAADPELSLRDLVSAARTR